ncbi:hypothetical protein [Hymenobacter volaticus]|uniref:Uncharacterized protein n=1 Tax=Hymenobacter volaticus TaxID=2932254 RepID=A0ABY4G2I7_9BACT|nr:hypothetical protein [Hymenobacter volaticus]UOQ64991.1 hypothetical protein MUN86_15650 [Hymenobacter volaticus]
MNADLFDHAGAYVKSGNIKQAIDQAELKLRGLDETYFHPILGASLLHQSEELVSWITSFYQEVSRKRPARALYFEMYGFDINTDQWYIDGFAYETVGTIEDVDWLADYELDMATSQPFVLTGFELMQEAFEAYMDEEEPDELEEARDIAELLVILRLQELLAQAHQLAKARRLDWGTIVLLATAHDYDMILESK